jgi:hypothetical protein
VEGINVASDCFCVAERRWKLARHEASGHGEKRKFVPEGRWKCANEIVDNRFRRPAGTENVSGFYQTLRVWLISKAPSEQKTLDNSKHPAQARNHGCWKAARLINSGQL